MARSTVVSLSGWDGLAERAQVGPNTRGQREGDDVSFGSKADLMARKSDFRFTPESGLKWDIAACRFRPILLQKSAAADGLSVILFNGDRL